ncbi:MAG: hypothetical protein ABJZ92_08895, partial [Cyclobacteriaceae bacterium]
MMNLIFKRSIYYALSLLPAGVFAQVILPGTYDYDRFIYDQLKSDSTSAITYQSSIFYGNSEGFTLINPLAQTSFNSAYPRSYNDGPVWKSKGLTQEVHSGVQFKKGVIHFTFHPVAYFSQNSSYRLASVNPDQNPLNYQFGVSRNVDFVQRYGTSSFVKFHPGQSEIAVRFKHFQFAASTQNFTLGPAIKNHIIMGNSASGFPHLTIGTPGKVDLRFKGVSLGAIEANLFYGLLSESNHFDTLSNNNRRYLNGMSLGYEVPYIKGLTVGFQRTLYKDTRYFESAD